MDIRRLTSILDDVTTFTRLLAAHEAELLYGGVAGVRAGALLWHYLRARHYGRQALALATGESRGSRGVRAARWREQVLTPVTRRFEEVFESERLSHVFRGDWAVEQVLREVIERDPMELVLEMVELAAGTPLSADLLEDDDLALVQAALATRHDARVVIWELGRLSDGDWRPLQTVLGETRRADRALTALVNETSALGSLAAELRQRFYGDTGPLPPTNPGDSPAYARDLLAAEDFPWLGGPVDGGRGGPWWT